MNLLAVLKKVSLPQSIVIAAGLGAVAYFSHGEIASVEGVAKMVVGLVGSIFLAVTSGGSGQGPSGDAPATP